MNLETLQEELSVCLRAAAAHPPLPIPGSEALKALQALMKIRPIQAKVGLPMYLSGAQEWAHGLMQIALAYTTFGLKVDMQGVLPSPFVEKLLEKDEE